MGLFDVVTGVGSMFLGDMFNRRNSAEAHDWAAEDAHIARQWQERMSSTAHQREVTDLHAAGLNPILSATGGAGASTPGGAMPSVDKADSPDVSGSIANALQSFKNSQEVKLMKAQEEVASTAADVNRAQAKKTNKESDILGPKSYIFDKITEGLKSVPDAFKNLQNRANPKYENPGWNKIPPAKMKGKP